VTGSWPDSKLPKYGTTYAGSKLRCWQQR
jgi:hypothetical protein